MVKLRVLVSLDLNRQSVLACDGWQDYNVLCP